MGVGADDYIDKMLVQNIKKNVLIITTTWNQWSIQTKC